MKVTLVSPRAWHVATNRPGIHGGAELQMTRIARGLARRGDDVRLLVADPGGASSETVEGVTVVPAWSESGGIPFFRLFRQRGDLTRAVEAGDPEYVLQRAASPFTGFLADAAGELDYRFVFLSSNDSNVDGRWEAEANARDRAFYQGGLKRAAGIIVQSRDQARMLRERTGREGFVLPSIALPFVETAGPRDRVFWAGRFEPHKRPHLILELARRAPDLAIAVAGWVPGEKAYAREFETTARGVGNITLLGRLDAEQMAAEYRRAFAFLSTSEYEGVSNTFLEAWRFGTPVVSMASDPDEAIREKGLGVVTADLDGVVAALRAHRDEPARREAVERAAKLHLADFAEEAVIDRLRNYLESL